MKNQQETFYVLLSFPCSAFDTINKFSEMNKNIYITSTHYFLSLLYRNCVTHLADKFNRNVVLGVHSDQIPCLKSVFDHDYNSNVIQ